MVVILIKTNITRRGLHLQFFSSAKPAVSKLCKFQMEGSVVLVSLPVLQCGASQKALASQNASLGPEISISLLRKLYASLIIFLDKIMLMTSSKDKLVFARETLIYLL